MCPVINLKICEGLYEKYLAVKKKFDTKKFYEEPPGVIRIRTTDPEEVCRFWSSLGFNEPLLFYVFAGTPEYRKLLALIKYNLSENELENVYILNAETGESCPLIFDEDTEPVLLTVHARPIPHLEKKLLSVFDISNPDNEDDDGEERECRTRDAEGRDNEYSSPVASEFERTPIASIELDNSEEEFIRQILEREHERKKRIKSLQGKVRIGYKKNKEHDR